ncbi:hypothetical protein [Sphingomonas profundi]|uniref:extracellular catalytic domain type 2 short-chain-length polyhydroxyalkanoate depolymerase n=1 Tax=Alterirhizorhabdus profundi TaxID=2681549 RepID=UPI0018D1CB00|nr:hypothetical protein [Sphingomonas profundi]
MADPLPRLGADGSRVSVSGLSSGGYMAVQYEIAYSASTIGAGIVAGGPYDCAGIYLWLTLSVCMQGHPTGTTSWRAARAFARNGLIDPAAGVAAHRVYLFSGTRDRIVAPSVMDGLRDFYHAAGVPPASLVYVNTVPAGHAFISVDTASADCAANGDTYIDRCTVAGRPYDQPQAILGHIYGPLQPKATTLTATPVAFDQGVYASPLAQMAPRGFVYVPRACRDAPGCAVHVVFHGCGQSALSVGDDVYGKLGYNAWADGNRIIMLYPQVNGSPANPNGCWDWVGYTGINFMLRDGPQLAAVKAMVSRLVRAPDPAAP